MKQVTSPGLLHETGHSGLVHWDDPEGWGGRWERGSGWRTRVHPGLIHVNVWQKPLQYCKVTSLQLKKKKTLVSVSCHLCLMVCTMMVLYSRGHLAMSGDTFGCHDQEKVVLVFSG